MNFSIKQYTKHYLYTVLCNRFNVAQRISITVEAEIMEQTKLENKISLLRDERNRNGWNEKEAYEHEYLMEMLRTEFPKSKYV